MNAQKKSGKNGDVQEKLFRGGDKGAQKRGVVQRF